MENCVWRNRLDFDHFLRISYKKDKINVLIVFVVFDGENSQSVRVCLCNTKIIENSIT